MEFLFNFSALIQLVAAINFAYILCKFNERFDNVISNSSGYIQRSFERISAKIELDTMTLKSKSASVQAEGLDCTAFIDRLTKSLDDIDDYKERKKEQIEGVIKLFVNKEGYGSLFLFLSLYTVLDLGIIAWISVGDNWNISLFLYIVNILSLFYAIFQFVYSTISSARISNRTSIVAFVCIIIISSLLVWANSKVQNPTPMSSTCELVFSLISIGLPFLAIGLVSILLTSVNLWAFVYAQIIRKRTKNQRDKVKKELKKVDTALEVINPEAVLFK